MQLKIISILFMLALYTNVKAQDPIFTQYFMVPESLNPGFTGFLETTTAGVLHRTQWPDLNFRVDTDYGYVNSWWENMNSGIGISVLSHREKYTSYNFTQLNLSYAYRVQISDDWYFRPAIEIGFGNKSYGFQNIILEDQINIGAGTINPVSIDPILLNSKVNFFDISAGMLINNENSWFGASLKHLNQPNISFTENGNTPLDMFFSANAGYEFRLADYLDVLIFPYETKVLLTANYMTQGEYNRLDIGAGMIFNRLFFGVTAATNPTKNTPGSHLVTSINAYGGLYWDHFRFGYSYDFNTSSIGRTGGVYEISIRYQFDMDSDCQGCPTYY
jgi:type IX secretion system PorP/SprF family membrane protein